MNINGTPIPDYILYAVSAFAVVFLANLVLKGKGLTDTRKLVTYAGGGLLIVLAVLSYGGILPFGGAALAVPVPAGQIPVAPGGVAQTIDLSSTVTLPIEVVNSLNSTGGNTEYKAANITPFTAAGAALATIRVEATASGASWTGGKLGNTYTLKGVSYNNSLNSFEDTVTFGVDTAPPIKRISTTKATTLTFRVWDTRQAGWMYDTGDSEVATAESSGTVFSSTVNNATQTALGAGQSLKIRLEVTPTTSTGRFGDKRLAIGFNAPTTSYKPENTAVSVVGASGYASLVTSDVPSQITTDGIDKLFIMPVTGIGGTDSTTVDITVPAKDDTTNPSDDVDIYFYNEGTYLENNVMKTGWVLADGTTYVHGPQSLTVQVS